MVKPIVTVEEYDKVAAVDISIDDATDFRWKNGEEAGRCLVMKRRDVL